MARIKGGMNAKKKHNRVLKNMSEDEIKRMEYEARQKAIRDYNSYMHSAERRGVKRGIKSGIKIGQEELMKQLVKKKLAKGKEPKVIADELELEVSDLQRIIREDSIIFVLFQFSAC